MNIQHWRPAFISAARRSVRRSPHCRPQWVRSYGVEAPPPPPPPPPPPQGSTFAGRTKTFAKWTGIFCLSSVVGIVSLTAGILAHDAFTYNEKHADRVPLNPLALHPETGGPKNLPVARVLIDDEEDDEAKQLLEKPKLVIIGAGWGVSCTIDLIVGSTC